MAAPRAIAHRDALDTGQRRALYLAGRENGAGKSTLARAVAGLVRPDGGRILVEDPCR